MSAVISFWLVRFNPAQKALTAKKVNPFWTAADSTAKKFAA